MKERMCDNGLLAYIPIHIHTHICTHTYICLCINKNIRIHSEHGDTITEEIMSWPWYQQIFSAFYVFHWPYISLMKYLFLLAFNRYMNDLFQRPGLRSMDWQWEKADYQVPWNVRKWMRIDEGNIDFLGTINTRPGNNQVQKPRLSVFLLTLSQE